MFSARLRQGVTAKRLFRLCLQPCAGTGCSAHRGALPLFRMCRLSCDHQRRRRARTVHLHFSGQYSAEAGAPVGLWPQPQEKVLSSAHRRVHLRPLLREAIVCSPTA